MEVSSAASTSRQQAPRPAPSHDGSKNRAPPPKRHKPDIVAPSSPSKSNPRFQQQRTAGPGRFGVDKEQEARREASLLSFAEARAKASSTYSSAHDDADFHHPPAHRGDSSARGLLEQIKNRMDQRAPKHSNFLQKAKQVQQSLLDKQQRHAQLQKAREEAEKRESARSAGFADPHAAPSREGSSQSHAAAAIQGAFSRAKARAASHDDESDLEDDADEPDAEYTSHTAVNRDDDLALVETLRPGPRPIPPNPDDPKWLHMEPYSGHRLRERKLPHSSLKDHLRGRYHITPSLLYSIARPIFNPPTSDHIRNGDYEVPVDGDWIVIATIVEKSELLVTKGFRSDSQQQSRAQASGSAALEHDGEDGDADPLLFKPASSDGTGKLRLDLEPGNPDAFATPRHPRKPKPTAIDDEHELARQRTNLSNRSRKFVILKLVDLGVDSTRADGTGSAGRGDNYLSLIAYESDCVDPSLVLRNTNVRSDVSAPPSSAASAGKKWINGSRGAFELLYQQAEGTVVAVMNPKVLRPFAPSAGAKPGGLESKMLRITPRSAEDCLVIGQAADYRRCSAIKANGQRCASFVDVKARKQTRTSTCDYHLQRHMDELARGRPEFAANATARFGGTTAAAAAAAGSGASSAFPNRKGGGGGYADSAINSITTSYSSSSNPYARAALARKLNSSHANVADGMESNAGAVYVSPSPLSGAAGGLDAAGEVRASDPSSWKYDVSGRYGRGSTEKKTRLRRQIEEEQLMRKIEARFAPVSEARQRAAESAAEGDEEEGKGEKEKRGKKGEPKPLPILPNGTAAMIHAAYSTLEQRKRVAAEKQAALDAKRRKYTGVLPSSTSSSSEAAKLQFASLSTSTAKRSAPPPLPIPGMHTPSSAKAGDSRSTLLSLATATSTAAAAEPSLKIKRCHRPKLNLPGDESSESNFKVVAGELVHLGDFADDAWEDDLDDDGGQRQSREDQQGQQRSTLSERILHLHSQSNPQNNDDDDDDSDLEII